MNISQTKVDYTRELEKLQLLRELHELSHTLNPKFKPKIEEAILSVLNNMLIFRVNE